MKSFQVKGKETEELNRLYKKLEQEWQAFKESKPTTYPSSSNTNNTIKSILQRDISPRTLMFVLQRESLSPKEGAWKSVINDIAVQEILQERREAIESGKLKGRRLFQSMRECANMGPQHETRSIMSIHYSEDYESSGRSKTVHDYSSSSSSSSCVAGASNGDKDQVVEDIRVDSIGRPEEGRRRYAVLLGGFAIVLLVIAMCMRLPRSSGGYDYNVILVPT